MNKLNSMWSAAMALALLATALTTWTSLTGCTAPNVIRSDELVTPVRAGQSFVAPMDGWFLSDALYLRYRKAVADRIQEEQGRGR
jgi:hypothetical protein